MRGNLAQTHKPMRRCDVQSRTIDDEVLIYDEKRGATFRLNATAGFIWQCCDGVQTADAIAKALVSIWQVSSDRARDDVEQALKELADQRLIGWVQETWV